MFITTQGFKNLIKEMYKAKKLHIANDGEGYTISGWYWDIWIAHGWIPKKELAAIIELTGEMPAAGAAFTASKDGNQYELEFLGEKDTMQLAWHCDMELDITPIVLKYDTGQQARVLQRQDNGKIVLINERFMDMIDNAVVEYGKGESQAEGPFIHSTKTGIFYRNDTMAMRIMPRIDDKNVRLLEYLEKFEIIGAQEDGLSGNGIPEAGKEKEKEEA